MQPTDMGTLNRDDGGRCALSFERLYDHPVEKVWRALTETEHLRGWFAQYLDYDRSRLDLSKEGAELEFRPGAGVEQLPVQTGRVTRTEPPTLLEYTWGEETLRWELVPVGNTGTRLTFTNWFADPSFAPFNALGWHTGLERLSAIFDGNDPNDIQLEADENAATQLQQRYEQAFA